MLKDWENSGDLFTAYTPKGLFDRYYCFDFKGPSFRGKHKIATPVNFASTPILPMVK